MSELPPRPSSGRILTYGKCGAAAATARLQAKAEETVSVVPGMVDALRKKGLPARRNVEYMVRNVLRYQ